MKKIFLTLTLVLSLSALSFADTDYGHFGLEDNELTLESMLTYAIEDEYLARAEYYMIMDEYGQVNPFSNIVRAEETHVKALEDLFVKYELPIPTDEADLYVALPESLTSAFETGVQAEIDNIEMYELFLEEELPSDVRVVFESLKRASENHKKAFERNSSKTGTGFGKNRNGKFRGNLK